LYAVIVEEQLANALGEAGGKKANEMAQTYPDGVRISYDDSGQGEPALLFMPGWWCSREMFARLLPLCASRRRVLALDWRGHGQSESPEGDFGTKDMVEDALAVIEASGAQRVVPVAQAHANWMALELRRRLSERILRVVSLSWIVLDPPPPFLGALEAMQDPERWEQAREGVFSMWLKGVDDAEVIRFVREEMGSYGFEMCSRAGREISAAYAREGNPLRALASLESPVPWLHLYAQPPDPGYLAAQQAFAEEHPWFSVRKLEAQSHFPSIEVPDKVAEAIESFVTQEVAR
jgi:pimeloyl-ACP methyl ester carboxylesterase